MKPFCLVFLLGCGAVCATAAQDAAEPAGINAVQSSDAAPRDLFVTVGKSLVVESPVNIQRISIADANLAEAVAVSPKEVLVNGIASGETSLIVWQQGGNRLLFDLRVRPNTSRLEAVRQTIARELPGDDITLRVEDGTVFLHGTAKDLVSGERAATIAGTLGKVVNLLHVKVPVAERQILLKVRFANVDRGASLDFATNSYLAGKLVTPGAIIGQQFQDVSGALAAQKGGFALTDALNLFLFRRDPNFGAMLRALQQKNLLEMLAEPNLLAANGKQASFLAGGEIPIPMLQTAAVGGAAGAVTIQYREFGVRINFVPRITPRGTIWLEVEPEVSSLDYAHAVTLSGFTIPAMSTRRVKTEVELESGQSFAIAGLLNNEVIDNMSKIPGLGDIPILGRLFQNRTTTKNNTELLVLVTPELVNPIAQGQPVPEIKMPSEFLKGAPTVPPRTPANGPVTVKPAQDTLPFEELKEQQRPAEPTYSAPAPVQIVPVPMPSAAAPPGAMAAPAPRPASASTAVSPRQ